MATQTAARPGVAQQPVVLLGPGRHHAGDCLGEERGHGGRGSDGAGGGGGGGGRHVQLHLAEDRVAVLRHPALHPLARLDQQLLLLPAEDADPDHLTRRIRRMRASVSAMVLLVVLQKVPSEGS